MKIFQLTLGLSVWLTLSTISYMYGQTGDYKFHKIFIANFIKYIKWPESYQTGDFVIGVLGESPIIAELQDLAKTKTAGNQKIIVKKFPATNKITTCHMIFIPNAESDKLNEVKRILDGKSTLIMTEKANMCQQGSIANFILQNGRWRFELNKAAADKAKLNISVNLTKVAIMC
ncbi:MAG: YfiR family protein [Microscillaceae bacterium]|nr:YfiR family protein [Microscillaceae bacterium]MDW8460915.1 YfiR family protein [Cytophagales bacterium]